ncbi:MAG TPA: hypothetical protein VJX23_11725 [Candidatus Binataceae bacterium]|nr:hypothetical protein [Candidatus Binataceae bacterium]
MKKLIALAAMVALGLAGPARAGTLVAVKETAAARELRIIQARDGHPLTHVIPAADLNVKVTRDVIMRSCCTPPALLVAGDVTNTTIQPLDYVKLILTFEDEHGKVVYTESLYNSKAASLNDDAEVQRILNEKPHFDPLPPGASDHFAFNVPMPMVPHFTKVELVSEPTRGSAPTTVGAR